MTVSQSVHSPTGHYTLMKLKNLILELANCEHGANYGKRYVCTGDGGGYVAYKETSDQQMHHKLKPPRPGPTYHGICVMIILTLD